MMEATGSGGVDLSELHLTLDKLRQQLCHCGNKSECLGCKGIEMIRQQAQACTGGLTSESEYS